jgi:CRISPR/Cas system CMR-associated protein Cmr3 (group 5 of RAMP superfamily)
MIEKLFDYKEPDGTNIRVERDLNICQYVVRSKPALVQELGDASIVQRYTEKEYQEIARFVYVSDLIHYLAKRLE